LGSQLGYPRVSPPNFLNLSRVSTNGISALSKNPFWRVRAIPFIIYKIILALEDKKAWSSIHSYIKINILQFTGVYLVFNSIGWRG
jgi:hypothetical protein